MAPEEVEGETLTDVGLCQYMFIPDTRLTMFDHVKMLQIACGRYHTLFLTANGEVYACGLNSFGQLGLGKMRTNDTVAASN
jgi:alpha-tubulin suppressor-like RCC1 family protein